MVADRVPQRGDRWLVRHMLPSRHRVAVVDAIVDGKHHFDKGPTAPPPDDVVVFRFDDEGSPRTCPMGAWLRTYVPEREAVGHVG